MIYVAMVGDVYGSIGRACLAKGLQKLKAIYPLDVIIVNGENTTHGKSINYQHYQEFKALGVDVITSGNHIFALKETQKYITHTSDLLRPLNLASFLPGNGTVVITKQKTHIRITNLMGRAFMPFVNNPYEAFDNLLATCDESIHLVDFHAESTAEKIAFAWNYDGVITAFAGTHTHVQTNDARLLPQKTAFITDLGMTGVLNSAIGADFANVITKEKYGFFNHFRPAEGPGVFCAAVIAIENKTAQKIIPIRYTW